MNYLKFFPVAAFFAFTLIITVHTLSLKKKKIRVGSGVLKTGLKNLLLYAVFLPASVIIIFEIIRPALPGTLNILPDFVTKSLSDSLLLKISGTIVIGASLLLLVVNFLHAGTSFRFGMDPGNTGKLVTGGVFSITRNPFFLSIDLFFAGNALFFSSILFISVFFAACISIHFFMLKEEKFLLKMYGDEYREYHRRTKRYFGRKGS